MDTFTFPDGLTIPRLGFGAMRLTGQPANFGPYKDWDVGIALLRAAYEAGIRHFDTARAYGPDWSERIIREAFEPFPGDIFIATKGGINKDGPSGAHIKVDGRPAALREHIDHSLEVLGRDRLSLFYLHRPDPSVPFEASLAALDEARQAGKIERIGISNVTEAQLEHAMQIAPISAVQNRYDPLNGGDEAVLNLTTAHGIAFVPWGPLAAKPLEHGSPLSKVSGGVRSALRDLMDRAPNILPIPGTTSREHMLENVAAVT